MEKEIEQKMLDIIKNQENINNALVDKISALSLNLFEVNQLLNYLMADFCAYTVKDESESVQVDLGLIRSRKIFCSAFPEKCDEFDDEKVRSHLSIVK